VHPLASLVISHILLTTITTATATPPNRMTKLNLQHGHEINFSSTYCKDFTIFRGKVVILDVRPHSGGSGIVP